MNKVDAYVNKIIPEIIFFNSNNDLIEPEHRLTELVHSILYVIYNVY